MSETTTTCSNCRFWPLNLYSQGWVDRGEKLLSPGGLHGPSTDGSVSDCRRRSPVTDGERAHRRYPHENALWPTTRQDDWCGDFEQRIYGNAKRERQDSTP